MSFLKRWRGAPACDIIAGKAKLSASAGPGGQRAERQHKEETPVEAQKSLVRGKLTEWDRLLEEYRLPGWEDFPELPLYMDQVIYLMDQYLSPLPREAEQKAVTPAMINNYVKLGIIPRPSKKRYGRVHLAFLVMVCVLKQTISTAEIKKLVPAELSEEETRARYEAFSAVFRAGKQDFRENVQKDAASVFGAEDTSANDLVFRAAFMSGLWQNLAKLALALYPEENAEK